MADVVVDEPLYGELDLEWEILVGHEIYTEDCDWLMAHLHARGQLEQPGLGRGAEQDGRVVNLKMLSLFVENQN